MSAGNDRDRNRLLIRGHSPAPLVQSSGFDTLKLWIPASPIVEYDAGADLPHGVRWIRSYGEAGVRMEFSAKVLQDRYPELLTLTTIREAFNRMNESGCLIVNPEAVLELATVERADRTIHLGLSRPASDYVRSLRLAAVSEDWRIQPFRDERAVPILSLAHGVTIERTVKSFSEWLSLYSKAREMKKRPVLGVEPELFRGVLRVEYRISTGSRIRERLKIRDARLETVLGSDANPAFELLQKWRNRSAPLSASGRAGYFTAKGMRALYDEQGGDFAKIEIELKRIGLRPGYWLPRIRAIAETPDKSLLEELLSTLNACSTLAPTRQLPRIGRSYANVAAIPCMRY